MSQDDLGLKVVPKEQAKWERVRDQAISAIDSAKTEIEINEAILTLAKSKLKKKFW